MKQGQFHPKQLHLVLIGGGHAQVQVLKSFAMKPLDGLAITLITDVLYAPYSGMLPGFVEGVWKKDDIHIDLTRLASLCGATLIHDHVSALDPESQTIHFTARPSLSYDVLSLNCGAVPDIDQIAGARSHAIAVKPIAHFLEKCPDKIADNCPINIIGAGVAGMELAFAFHAKYKSQAPDIHVFSRSKTILAKMPKTAIHLATNSAKAKGITLHHDASIAKLSAKELITSDGTRYRSGLNFVVTGVKPSPFIDGLDKALDKTGFVAVKDTLQSPIYPAIFAAGDVASLIGNSREKAGVFAVRAGPILAENLRRFILGKGLKSWRPQKNYLALIGTGDGKAIAIRNGIALHHSFFWRLKIAIDKAFMDKFTQLPQMQANPPKPLPLYEAKGHDIADPIFTDMRCTGCAAKASASLLDRAMEKSRNFAKAQGVDLAYLPKDDAITEDAGLTKAISADLRHSFDSLSQMVSDPYLFAQIAVNHALSDLYVAGAIPLYAQAHITLEEASEPYQEQIATHYLNGAIMGLAAAKTQLIGGHTSQASSASLGFAVTGAQTYDYEAYKPDSSYQLLMTKRLGIGAGLAAHMRQKISAPLYQAIIDDMLLSNAKAAEILFSSGTIAMTDITGFGLARHTQNLLTRCGDKSGVRLSLAALPVFDGIKAVLQSGVRSSLYNKNKEAAFVIPSPLASQDWRYPLLFDPQTSGGVLAILPKDKADKALKELKKENVTATVIGDVITDANGLLVEP